MALRNEEDREHEDSTAGINNNMRNPNEIDTALAVVEQVLVESGFQKAIAKLKWLLPFKHPDHEDWDRLEELTGTLDTSILHDVVLDNFEELSRKHRFKLKDDPRQPSKAMVDRTMQAMVDHVQHREVLERNLLFGNKLLELVCAGLIEYDLPEDQRFQTILAFIKQNGEKLQQEKNALIFRDQRRSDAEIDLTRIRCVIDDAKNQLTANMEANRLHERQIDNEMYETTSRVEVELGYTEEFTEHQLQFMAFTLEHQENLVYQKRLEAARRYESCAQMHKASKDMFRKMYEEQEARQEERMYVAEKEQERLEKDLGREMLNIEELENEMRASKLAIQHHQTVIDQLRSVRAEEVAKEQELLRIVSAVIRIQRWWKYHVWLKSKEKERKNKKGKRKAKQRRLSRSKKL